jgi:hypothetical protein
MRASTSSRENGLGDVVVPTEGEAGQHVLDVRLVVDHEDARLVLGHSDS